MAETKDLKKTITDYTLIAYLKPHNNRRFDIVKLNDLAAKNSSFVWAGEDVYLKGTQPEVDCWILIITDDLEYLNNNFEEITKQFIERGYHRSDLFPKDVVINNKPPFSVKNNGNKPPVKINSDCLCTKECRHGKSKIILSNSKSEELTEFYSLENDSMTKSNNQTKPDNTIELLEYQIKETNSAFQQLLLDYHETSDERYNLLKIINEVRISLENGVTKMENIGRSSNISTSPYSNMTPIIKYYDARRDIKNALKKLRSIETKNTNTLEIAAAESSSDDDKQVIIDLIKSQQNESTIVATSTTNHEDATSDSLLNHVKTPSRTPTPTEICESSSNTPVSTTKNDTIIVVPQGPSSCGSSLTSISSSSSTSICDKEKRTGLKRKRSRGTLYSPVNENNSENENSRVELSDDNEDCEMVTIGESGRTKIQKCIFNNISLKKYSVMTRVLLQNLFTRETLATSSMTGKMSPAFLNSNKKPRKPLDPIIVQDIVQCVTKYCQVPASVVRSVITTKCADENKMLKLREKKKGKENLFD